MAQVAVDYILDKITKLQDDRAQAERIRDAALEDAAKKLAGLNQELADWGDVLDRYYGTQEQKPAPAKGAAAKKTAAPREK